MRRFLFNKRSDIRNNMEPRMKGTMYFDGDELRGKTFSIQKGIYRSFDALGKAEVPDLPFEHLEIGENKIKVW